MRQYARHLKGRVDEGKLAGSTINTYWNYIAALLGWRVYEEFVAENPVPKRRAEEELPDKRPRSDRQQFWSRSNQEALLAHLNERAYTAVDERGLEAVKGLRNRALAALLAYSGVCGGEILRDPNDRRRSGLRWQDVDLDAGTIVVLGKNQTDEEALLPSQACEPLDRLQQVLRPASEDWPVFPSLHRPTLSQTVRAVLADAGYDTDEIEAAINEQDWLALYREHGVVPPALTTNGGRTVMRRVCEEVEITLDGEHDYLTPHGGR
jgi:integrase